MTTDGDGNTAAGVSLAYALDHVDLTSAGNNTQFFLEFGSIQRLPVQTPVRSQHRSPSGSRTATE
jgi:hypothetical protein